MGCDGMYVKPLIWSVSMEVVSPDLVAKLCIHGVDRLKLDRVRCRRFLFGSLH